MPEFTPEEIEKAKQQFKELAEQGRTQGDIRKSYHDIPDKPKTGGGGGGSGIPKVGPKKPMDMKKGGKISSASKRADGCCQRGKTKGQIV